MRYRRTDIPGASYFFTLVTEQRQNLFIHDENIELLRESFRQIKQKRPFIIEAAVIMPDHLHCIWTLPDNDADYSTRWRLIKAWFTKHCDQKYKLPRNNARMKKQQQAIWQHRYWEYCLKDEEDFERHVDYIHYNPVKHHYVESPPQWKHSSIHRYIKEDILPRDWAGSDIIIPDIDYD